MPNLSLSTGSKIVFLSDSGTQPPAGRWADYIRTYLYLRHPDLDLRMLEVAGSGSKMEDWTDGVENERYSRYAYGLFESQAGTNFAMCLTNGNGSSVGHTYRGDLRNLVDNHMLSLHGVNPVTPVLIGSFPAPSSTGGSFLSREADDAHVAEYESDGVTLRAPAFPQHNTTTAMLPVWTAGLTYTADSGSNTITTTSPHGFSNGDRVMFAEGTLPSPLVTSSGNLPVFYYVREATESTFKVATTLAGATIDLTTNGSGTRYVSSAWPKITAPAINWYHPSPCGNIIAAYLAMTGLGWGSDVSSATISANTLTVTTEADCSCTGVVANSYGGIDFSRLDARLPWAIDEEGRADAVSLVPEIADWQQYLLTVEGLSAGTYDVHINGTKYSELTHSELAAGWNMSSLTSGPAFVKGQELLGRIRDMQGISRTTLEPYQNPGWFGVAMWRSNASAYFTGATVAARRAAILGTNMNAARASIAYYEGLVHAQAQPESLSFSLRRQGYTPPTSPTTTKRSRAHVGRILGTL